MVVFVIISSFIAVGRVFAVVIDTAGAAGIFTQIGAIIAYIAPYFLITTAFKMSTGILGAVGGIANDRTKGGFDRLRNFRSNEVKGRREAFKNRTFMDQGRTTLFRPGRRGPLGAIGRAGESLNRRTTSGWGMGFTDKSKGRQALQGQEDARRTLESNKRLGDIANMDDANALLFLSAGRRGNAEEAARKIFTDSAGVYDSARAARAMGAASVVGFNEMNSRAAMQTVMKNKARAIPAGRIDLVSDAIRDLSHGNAADAEAMIYQAQFDARGAGRADLGGNWMDTKIQSRALTYARSRNAGMVDEQQLRATDAFREGLSNLTALDGMKRTSVQQLMNAYPSQASKNSEALVWALNNARNIDAPAGADELVVEAARRVEEISGSMSYATGGTQERYNTLLQTQLGFDMAAPLTAQTARMAGARLQNLRPGATAPGLSQQEILNGARVYSGGYNPNIVNGAGTP
jgi:hypothetical protein